MNAGFNARSHRPTAVRKEPNEQHTLPNSTLSAAGFNIWWQKTFAQHAAMAAEASALMRAHRRVSSGWQGRLGPTH